MRSWYIDKNLQLLWMMEMMYIFLTNYLEALHKSNCLLSRMEEELEWESSNVAFKTKIIKHQNRWSGCPLLTLKQKRSSHSSKSKRESHGEEQPQQWREWPAQAPMFSGWKWGGSSGRLQAFCAVRDITGGWRHELPVISQYHCRLRFRTGSKR